MSQVKEIYFGMFTDAGNHAVHEIVKHALENKLAWLEVYQDLCHLSKVKAFGEATDTMVREMVYDACGFESDFYI